MVPDSSKHPGARRSQRDPFVSKVSWPVLATAMAWGDRSVINKHTQSHGAWWSMLQALQRR